MTFIISMLGVRQENVDVLITDAYIKVNSPPHLFSVDLIRDIDSSHSRNKIIVGDNEVRITVLKKIPVIWKSYRSTGSKSSIAKRRETSLIEYEKRMQAQQDAQKDWKQAQEKAGEKHQWRLDQEQRELIEARKLKEKEDAVADIANSFRSPDKTAAPSGQLPGVGKLSVLTDDVIRFANNDSVFFKGLLLPGEEEEHEDEFSEDGLYLSALGGGATTRASGAKQLSPRLERQGTLEEDQEDFEFDRQAADPVIDRLVLAIVRSTHAPKTSKPSCLESMNKIKSVTFGDTAERLARGEELEELTRTDDWFLKGKVMCPNNKPLSHDNPLELDQDMGLPFITRSTQASMKKGKQIASTVSPTDKARTQSAVVKTQSAFGIF